jgi:hypothetical protein
VFCSRPCGRRRRGMSSFPSNPPHLTNTVQFSETTTQHTTLLDSLYTSLSQSHLLLPPSSHASLALHANLTLLPRWPGYEDDEDDSNPSNTLNPDDTASIAGTMTTMGGGLNKTYSQEELEGMNVKQLGKLKARGLDVEGIIGRKRKEAKGRFGKREIANVPEVVGQGEEKEENMVASGT